MKEHQLDYQVVFPTPDDKPLLEQASGLIGSYAEKGVMLNQTVEDLGSLAKDKNLVLAVSTQGHVLGSAAYTFRYPSGMIEFGAWAIHPDYIKHGVGKRLIRDLLLSKGIPNGLIAVANSNSTPIFQKLGGKVLMESEVEEAVFEPCKSCHCDKSALPQGRKCVDTIIDLQTAARRIIMQD